MAYESRPVHIFRGICIETRKWVYGNYVFQRGLTGACASVDLGAYGDQHFIITIDKSRKILIEESTVSQYVLIEDERGKKIFMGDILSSPLGDYIVQPIKSGLGFELVTEDGNTLISESNNYQALTKQMKVTASLYEHLIHED